MASDYQETTALIVLSGVFLALGAVFAAVVVADMLLRRAWKSMMWIMLVPQSALEEIAMHILKLRLGIPTYILNATFMGPLTLFIYFRYGRPSKPKKSQAHDHGKQEASLESPSSKEEPATNPHGGNEQHGNGMNEGSQNSGNDIHNASHSHSQMNHSSMPMDHAHMHGDMSSRPLWATVLIGVSHCGAGCVLGDLVGEWIVYGTGAEINNASVWPCLLIDYAFALLFGIIFQYFSIAPMSGQYGPKAVWRAAKADFLSLTFFEIGLFGWMVAYQVGIWNYRLEINTWTYWWMMQVGMILGFFTANPINWWLISKGIKEPCT